VVFLLRRRSCCCRWWKICVFVELKVFCCMDQGLQWTTVVGGESDVCLCWAHEGFGLQIKVFDEEEVVVGGKDFCHESLSSRIFLPGSRFTVKNYRCRSSCRRRRKAQDCCFFWGVRRRRSSSVVIVVVAQVFPKSSCFCWGGGRRVSDGFLHHSCLELPGTVRSFNKNAGLQSVGCCCVCLLFFRQQSCRCCCDDDSSASSCIDLSTCSL
jgi:hypothetical protein